MALDIGSVTFDPAAVTMSGTTGPSTASFVGLTAGKGLVVWVSGFDPGAINFTTCSVGSDSLTAFGSTSTGNGYAMRFFYIESLTVSGTQTVSVGYTGGQNGATMAITGVEISGPGAGLVGTGNPTSAANPTSFSWTNGAANSGMILGVEGNATTGTCAGYTLFDCQNGWGPRRMFFSNNVGGTSQTASPTHGYSGQGIEILAGTGGGSSVPTGLIVPKFIGFNPGFGR
jgi:hypothetical protein